MKLSQDQIASINNQVDVLKKNLLSKKSFRVAEEKVPKSLTWLPPSPPSMVNFDISKVELFGSIVKSKDGPFQLKMTINILRKVPGAYYPFDPLYVNEQSEFYIKTRGLVKFFGEDIFWNEKNTNLVNLLKIEKDNKHPYLGVKRINSKKTSQSPEILESNPENSIQITSAEKSMKRGIHVHKELEDFIKLGPEVFGKVHPQPDPLTVKIAQFFSSKGFYAVDAEYPVFFEIFTKSTPSNFMSPSQPSQIFDNSIFLASAVDFVCYDSINNKLVLIELKTGYNADKFFHQFISDEDYSKIVSEKKRTKLQNRANAISTTSSTTYVDPNNLLDTSKMGYMLGEVAKMKDCPINRAKVQLCAYMLFFKTKLNIDTEGYVIHCKHDGSVCAYDVNAGFYRVYSNHILTMIDRISKEYQEGKRN